jgi:predicted glycosyltransferase
MKRIAFYCQHVLGVGHLVRSTEIIRALCTHFSVLLISGGEPVDGFRFPPEVEVVNLPALQTDADFSELQVCNGSKSIEEILDARKTMLLSVLDRFGPDAFVIELFPFGRKRFAFELIPALAHIHEQRDRAKVVCSLRDILVQKRDQNKHEERVCNIVNRYFDLVLVHGDPSFQKLDETFSKVGDLNCPMRYTGYVAQPSSDKQAAGLKIVLPEEPFILVTIGSGRYRNGQKLLWSIIETAALLAQELPHRFVIFAGPFIPHEEFLKLKELAAQQPNITLDRYTPDLLQYMNRADLSISMGGYNTIMNILSTGTRAIVFPYTVNDDQEQYIRAEKLRQLGVIDMIHPDALEPTRLAAAIRAALRRNPAHLECNLHGAEESARLLTELLQPAERLEEVPFV